MKWLVICDRCGRRRFNSDLRKEWTGLMVCRDTCWEARHPQDLVKGRPDRMNPPWVRPEPTDVFTRAAFRRLETGGLRLLEQPGANSLTGSSARELELDP